MQSVPGRHVALTDELRSGHYLRCSVYGEPLLEGGTVPQHLALICLVLEQLRALGEAKGASTRAVFSSFLLSREKAGSIF